jgi:hypothetical protein
VVGQSFYGVLLGSWCSSLFSSILGTEVDDARDGSWRCCFVVRLYLVAKPAHVGVDVDGLACRQDHPTACNHQMRRHGLLPDVALSHRYSGRWHLYG